MYCTDVQDYWDWLTSKLWPKAVTLPWSLGKAQANMHAQATPPTRLRALSYWITNLMLVSTRLIPDNCLSSSEVSMTNVFSLHRA